MDSKDDQDERATNKVWTYDLRNKERNHEVYREMMVS